MQGCDVIGSDIIAKSSKRPAVRLNGICKCHSAFPSMSAGIHTGDNIHRISETECALASHLREGDGDGLHTGLYISGTHSSNISQ